MRAGLAFVIGLGVGLTTGAAATGIAYHLEDRHVGKPIVDQVPKEGLAAAEQANQRAGEIRAIELQLSATGKSPAMARPIAQLADVLAETTSLPRSELLGIAIHAFTQNRVSGLDAEKFTETVAYFAVATGKSARQADSVLTLAFENGYNGIVVLNDAFPTFDSRQLNHFRDLAEAGKWLSFTSEALNGLHGRFSGLVNNARAAASPASAPN